MTGAALVDTRRPGWGQRLGDAQGAGRRVSVIVDDRLPGEPYYDQTADYAIAVAERAAMQRIRDAHAAGPHWQDTAELVAALIAAGVAGQVGARLAELVDDDVCDHSVTTDATWAENDSRVTGSDLRIRRWLEAPPSGLERLAPTSDAIPRHPGASRSERVRGHASFRSIPPRPVVGTFVCDQSCDHAQARRVTGTRTSHRTNWLHSSHLCARGPP